MMVCGLCGTCYMGIQVIQPRSLGSVCGSVVIPGPEIIDGM